MKSCLFIVRTRSNLHCGTGQGHGDIDQPVARDSVTGFPIIPGASLKGVLRDGFERQPGGNSNNFKAVFGEANKNKIAYASAVSFGDGRLLCLPVRSYFGTFAWLTSPAALSPFREGLIRSGMASGEIPPIPIFEVDPGTYKAALPAESRLISSETEDRVLLEDLDLRKDRDQQATAEEWGKLIADLLYPEKSENIANLRQLFLQRFIVADDNILSFLTETALPVVARTRINNKTGVVATGALWYEEYVPAETIFFGNLDADKGFGEYKELSAEELLKFVTDKSIGCQVGGNATTGQGNVTITFNFGGNTQ